MPSVAQRAMRQAALFACALLLFASAPGQAGRGKKNRPSDPRTVGLGHSCRKRNDCRSRAQVCLHESDANGKPLSLGFCALPCTRLDAGIRRAPSAAAGGALAPGEPDAAPKKPRKKRQVPRCPLRYQCRGAGGGVPLDLCVKE